MAEKKNVLDFIKRIPHDRVLVQLAAVKDRTAGGLYLPDIAKGKPVRAKILKVGEGRTVVTTGERIAVPFTEGEIVTVSEWASNKAVPGFSDCAVVQMQDIEAVWSEDFLDVI